MSEPAEPHLIVVAYFVAPGPGGPEGHVNEKFLKALARHWPHGVSVITGGHSPELEDGRPLSGLPRWTFHALGECGEAGPEASAFNLLAFWTFERMRGSGPGRVPAKILNRLVYEATSLGMKMASWRLAAARVLRRELSAHPGAMVYSRALPFESLSAVADVRRETRFCWLANINDPLPASLWRGMYEPDSREDRKTMSAFREIIPLIDGFTFPCRRLMEMELESFPEIKNAAYGLLPHITNEPSPCRAPAAEAAGVLTIAFSGTLRKKRVAPELKAALESFAARHPDKARRFFFAFHLARTNPFGQEFIRSLPARTEVFLGESDAELGAALSGADVLFDLEAPEDKPLLLTKLVNYMGFRRPIWALCAEGGTAWELVRKSRGYVSPLASPEKIEETLLVLHADWSAGRLGARIPPEEVVERFSSRRNVEEFAAARDLALKGRRGEWDGAELWP
ncbi:MAG: hypothetical protein HY921_00235 [Elusimicrobia bacterium]|nr:hypothetical protein [Elusimicrobiota bacterium]